MFHSLLNRSWRTLIQFYWSLNHLTCPALIFTFGHRLQFYAQNYIPNDSFYMHSYWAGLSGVARFFCRKLFLTSPKSSRYIQRHTCILLLFILQLCIDLWIKSDMMLQIMIIRLCSLEPLKGFDREGLVSRKVFAPLVNDQ